MKTKERNRRTISLAKHTAYVCRRYFRAPCKLERFYKMPESNFDIDRLGMLTLEHFEHGVYSDSSCGENNSCHSELNCSNAYSPPYFTDESESPVSSPTEVKHSVKFWERNDDEMVGLEADDDVEDKWQKQPTCRYRRGTV